MRPNENDFEVGKRTQRQTYVKYFLKSQVFFKKLLHFETKYDIIMDVVRESHTGV